MSVYGDAVKIIRRRLFFIISNLNKKRPVPLFPLHIGIRSHGR
ncbi:hypothetical protein HMPREF1548_02647 [Clostridium sp. KLE 1755]|nr:hypothetical protein HMPREF1548_02647 [Clostridium sp. KLE 1755]